MKTTTSILLAALALAGLTASASAQAPDQTNATDQAAATAGQGMETTNAPQAGAMTAPPNVAAPDQGNPSAPTAQGEASPAEAGSAAGQAVTSTVILPRGGAALETYQNNFMPPAGPAGTNGELRLNFRNAPLEMVLNYLSDAAGFIIVQDTRVSGNVTVISAHPVTQDEAVNLLNTELNRNGYAAIRAGKTLTIMDKNDAKTRDIPVKIGNNPGDIPDNDEIATWIIPIRFVEARQLVSDLTSFVSPQATVVANEAGNSIVITDTQSNIRHLEEIIQAVDNSAEAETEIHVFHLKYANPNDVATELGNIFPNNTSGNGTQAPIQFRGGGAGGGRGGFAGGGGGPAAFFRNMMANAAGAAGANSQAARIQKETAVTAVPDSRIQAVIVSAPKDLMEQISGMMTDLDVPSDRDQDVAVIPLENADPQQVANVLQSMFGGTSMSGRGGSASGQNSALQQRQQSGTTQMGNVTSTSSTGVGSTGFGGGGGGGGGGRAF
ncbi:MAG: secretin N-terminal domain-containing protein [Verrucomicrobiota bacterium]|jgi:general secretion pathway protein D